MRHLRVTPQPARPPEPVGPREPRRGVALLPSLFTLGNMFCGYACVVYAMRGDYDTAAPFIGIAIVLDMLDGRIARLTGTASEFGVEFDSLADVISFGMAPAVLTFAWGLSSLGRLGWAAGFSSSPAPRCGWRGSTSRPHPPTNDSSSVCPARPRQACRQPPLRVSERPDQPALVIPAIALVLVPALLMVSSIRYRSFKTFDLQSRRPFRILLFFALTIPPW